MRCASPPESEPAGRSSVRYVDGETRELVDRQASELYVARRRREAGAFACGAGAGPRVAQQLFGQQLALTAASFELAEHAIEAAAHLLEAALAEREGDLAGPGAMQDLLLDARRKVAPGRGERDLERVCDTRQELTVVARGAAPAPRCDGLSERPVGIRHDLLGIDLGRAAEPVAALAGAGGAVEGEQPRRQLRKGDAAVGARVALREQLASALPFDEREPVCETQRSLERFDDARAHPFANRDAIDDQLDVVLLGPGELDGCAELVHRAVDAGAYVALFREVLELLLVLALAAAYDGGEHLDASALPALEHALRHLLDVLAGDGSVASPAVRLADASVEQTQVVEDLRHGADGRAWVAARRALFDGNGGREALDGVDVGLCHLLEKLARIGGEGFDVPPLAFGVEGVEGQGRLAATGEARDHHELTARQVHVHFTQVVDACAPDRDVARPGVARGAGRSACHQKPSPKLPEPVLPAVSAKMPLRSM
jgi:hypothetical protein